MMTFQEIRDHVHSICSTVDNEYDLETVDVQQAIQESCHEYWPMWNDVWSAAAGMRFDYYDTWWDAEQRYDGALNDVDTDQRLFIIVHECLRLLVEDAHENGDHLPTEED